MTQRPSTVGALRETGYRPRSVKQELRANLIESLAKKRNLFPGIVGFEATVVPQIENAILSGQDTGKEWERLTTVDRRAILEILTATKQDLPTYWKLEPAAKVVGG